MILEAQLPTLITVIVTAAIDSINPCAIGVLILMISVVLASGRSVRRLLILGGVYIFAILLVYLLAGIGLTYYFTRVPLFVAEYLSIAVAMILIAAGLVEVKDYFWYGKGFSLAIPARYAKKIHDLAEHSSVWGVFVLGAFVSAVELPCTGAPYLAIITILSQYFDFTAFLMLVLYNIVFILPLIVILVLVAAGTQLQIIKAWKQGARPKMRLLVGLLLIALSWILIFIANGTINLG